MAFDLFAVVMAILSVMSFGATGAADITDDTPKPGVDLIVGEWTGTASIPFVISVALYADIKYDGTAQFYGSVTSSIFGNHEFDTDAEWEYLGGDEFNTVISGTHTVVICSGDKLTFQLNPYKLGLTNNEIADKKITINLHRV